MDETEIIDRVEELERKLNGIDRRLRSYYVEAQVFSHSNKQPVLASLSQHALSSGLTSYYLERSFIINEISEIKNIELTLEPSCSVYALMGFKFLDSKGWGEYGVYRGNERVRTFFRHENGVESNVVLGSIYLLYYPDDILKIKQEKGFGEQKIELLGISLSPHSLKTPLLSAPNFETDY